MPDRGVDPRLFWEKKIMLWEEQRYGEGSSRWPLLERVASGASSSVRFRLALTADLLAPCVVGKKVVELGCGSGQLAPRLIAAGAREYVGFDIASNAVDAGRRKVEAGENSRKIRFEQCDVANLSAFDADIVISLGLFDWLSPQAIDRVFQASCGAEFLHSISEKRSTMTQQLHRLYVYLSYGHRTGAYVPRYYTAKSITDIAARHGQHHVHIHRDPRLSFGALVTSIPAVDGTPRNHLQ